MRLPPNLTDPAALALLDRMRAAPWRVVRSGSSTGADNMAADLALLDAAVSGSAPPTLRFYSWDPPAVSLGRFQDAAGVNEDYARSRGWDVVRRPTGGRGVLHQFELTYSIVLPPSVLAGIGVRTSYTVLVGALNAGLRLLLGGSLGEPAREEKVRCTTGASRAANCFALASECDTLVPAGKLVGSAQIRKDGALLQHGSILLDLEPEAWTALFGEPGHPVALRGLLGYLPAPADVEAALEGGFAAWGIELVPEPVDGAVSSRVPNEVNECRR